MKNKNSRVAKPGDSVLAVICHGCTSPEFLVQCNDNEESYCFPGGSIRFGENSYQAITREIREQYGFEVQLYGRPKLHQNMKEQPEGSASVLHQCAIKGFCLRTTHSHRFSEFQHQEYKKTKLRWCSETDLCEKSVYYRKMLESIFDVIFDEEGGGVATADEWEQIMKNNPGQCIHIKA